MGTRDDGVEGEGFADCPNEVDEHLRVPVRHIQADESVTNLTSLICVSEARHYPGGGRQ